MNNEIEAEKIRLKKVFSDFWFVVPEYQRSYVWGEDNINELLDDLWYAFEHKGNDDYFLGSLVLKNTNNEKIENEFEVLDGQQRLTTLFLLQAVIRDIPKDDKLKESFHKRIFQEKDEYNDIPERIRILYKIRDNVEDFVKDFVLKKEGTLATGTLTEKLDIKNISISNMARALLLINKFFNDDGRIENIDEFAKFLSKKIVFIYVATSNQEDAFKLFTILNNRGIPLTNADILKSINIGIVNEKERPKYAKAWEDVENDFGESFDRFLSFIRTIIVKEKARVHLLKEFEENIYQKEKLAKGIDTIEFIRYYKNIYDLLINFEELNLEDENKYKNLITIMQIGLPSDDWVPPLLYYYKKYGSDNLLNFLEKLEYKFCGDWILQETPTKRIENMNNILKSIEVSSSTEYLFENNSLFNVNNDELLRNLSGDVYGKRFARYILLKYEYTITDNTVHLSNYKYISVEHVLPQNPNESSEWMRVFNPDDRTEWTNKLANLVLISKKKNSKLSNLDFIEKKQRYLSSRIDIFKGSKIFMDTNDKWDLDLLKKRQSEMLDSLIMK